MEVDSLSPFNHVPNLGEQKIVGLINYAKGVLSQKLVWITAIWGNRHVFIVIDVAKINLYSHSQMLTSSRLPIFAYSFFLG